MRKRGKLRDEDQTPTENPIMGALFGGGNNF
jgi:hypothetical protein